jgi:hypothetical protein
MTRSSLRRKPCVTCGLPFRHRRDCTRYRAPKELKRGSGPAKRNSKLESARRKFKRDVFDRYGETCIFCGLPGAIDPAHIIPANVLGALRFADVRLARPAHRQCHTDQHNGKVDFPQDVILDAYDAHNAVSEIKLYPESALDRAAARRGLRIAL